MDDAVNENQLKEALEQYVKDLCKNKRLWRLNTEWVRAPGVIANAFFRVAKQCCSACQHSSGHVSILNVDLPVLRSYDRPLTRFVQTLRLPSDLKACLDESASKARFAFLLVNIQRPSSSDGHGIMMVFDKRRKTQIVFDPIWVHGHCPVTTAMCKRRFHPLYTPLPPEVCSFPDGEGSLQTLVESESTFFKGKTCGILVFIVMLCCMRFNYINPIHVGKLLKQIILPNNVVLRKLITFYQNLRETPDELLSSALLPTSPNNKCNVFSPHTRKLCSRKSCGQSALCWQHRFLVMNNKSLDKKCNAGHVACSNIYDTQPEEGDTQINYDDQGRIDLS